MDLARALQQCMAFPVRVVDLLDRVRDPVDGALGEVERQRGARRLGQLGDGVERGLDLGGPACRSAVADVAAGLRRRIDRLAQARRERPVVGMGHGRGRIEAAEQGQVALGHRHDHLHERVDVLFPEVSANARESASALWIACRIIGRERYRDHVLAEAPVRKGATGTLAPDVGAGPGKLGAVGLRPHDPCQHPLRLDAKEGDLPLCVIDLAARERLLPGQLAQAVDIEAWLLARLDPRFRRHSLLRLVRATIGAGYGKARQRGTVISVDFPGSVKKPIQRIDGAWRSSDARCVQRGAKPSRFARPRRFCGPPSRRIGGIVKQACLAIPPER
jgi:hypothetical protein